MRIAVAFLLLFLLPSTVHAQKRVALVIGNSAYKHAGELENPKNDAADMAAALKKLDFQVIDGIDLDKAAFDRRIRDFATALVGAEVAVLFYAGHGLQVSGQNYLVPTDAELTSAAALDFEMVRIDLIQRSMEREAQTSILFLDACRNNPLARNLARAMGTRSAQIGRGLASIESGVGTLISFSTQPGNVALDGTGRNSPFAGALVKHLSSSSDDLSAILISVRNDVMRDTQRQQVPWEHSALTGRFYFNLAAHAPQPADAAAARLREAADTWSTIKDTTNTSVLETYIARYQGTFYADLARRQLEELRKGQQANTATVAPSKSANTPPDAATTKRSLKLFKDVLARVQSDYVEERGEQVLVQTAVDGMLKKFPSGSGAESAKVLAIMPAKRTVGHNDQLLVPFGDVLQHVHREHGTGTGGVDPVIVAALEHMLAALDPHSAYLSPKHFRDMQTQTRGEFGGLGIEVSLENGVVKVVSPIDDTPAAAAGVQTNDLITHLDGASVAGLTLEQAVEKMRGPVNTSITLTIVRKGRDTPFDLKIVRAVIRINAVKARQEGDVIYIKISTFNEQAHPNLVKAVEALKKTMGKNIKGYIVDLRGNPGGLLDQAIQVTDDFLEKGAIVLTKARNAEAQRANAQPGDVTGGKRLIVLINGGSASASEIVAGALQDHKRAIVVGTRSFGKGSVQTIIPLGADNGAIRLTTARYYTPSGRSIQAQGIEPDVVVEQEQAPEPQSNTPPTSEARLPGHLKNKHGTESSGSSSYVPKDPDKDTQLQHALKALRSQR